MFSPKFCDSGTFLAFLTVFGFWVWGILEAGGFGGLRVLINGYREWVEELEALAGSSDNPEAQVKAKAKAQKEEEEEEEEEEKVLLCICCSQFL